MENAYRIDSVFERQVDRSDKLTAPTKSRSNDVRFNSFRQEYDAGRDRAPAAAIRSCSDGKGHGTSP
jgi:hypothetical protein